MRACPSTSFAFGADRSTPPKNSSRSCACQAAGRVRSESASSGSAVASLASMFASVSSRCQVRMRSRTVSSSSICSLTVRLTAALPLPRRIVISSTVHAACSPERTRSNISRSDCGPTEQRTSRLVGDVSRTSSTVTSPTGSPTRSNVPSEPSSGRAAAANRGEASERSVA